MLRRILTRTVSTTDSSPSAMNVRNIHRPEADESDAWLAEVSSGVVGLAIIGIGMQRVFALELDEPQRLLGLAVAILLGLAIIGIGLVGGLKARLLTSAPRT